MFNDVKYIILKNLKNQNGYISGNILANELSISRVALWKHIKSLNKLGYIIESSKKGYKFVSSPDLLLPYEFDSWQHNIFHFNEVESTMNVQKKALNDNDFFVFVAEKQRKGRGRFNRYWHSPQGGIYFTYCFKPDLAPIYASKIVLLFATIIAKTLIDLYNVDVQIKWPNDILIKNKKVCGILAELTTELDRIKQINIGIGINVNNSIADVIKDAISLKELIKTDIDRKYLFQKLLENIKKGIVTLKNDNILVEYKRLLLTLNKRVSIITLDEQIDGIAIDISPNGALLVKTFNGEIKSVVSGDCFHLN